MLRPKGGRKHGIKNFRRNTENILFIAEVPFEVETYKASCQAWAISAFQAEER